jgi:hypothetical protein
MNNTHIGLMLLSALAVLLWITMGMNRWHENGKRGSELLFMLAGPIGWSRLREFCIQGICFAAVEVWDGIELYMASQRKKEPWLSNRLVGKTGNQKREVVMPQQKQTGEKKRDVKAGSKKKRSWVDKGKDRRGKK